MWRHSHTWLTCFLFFQKSPFLPGDSGGLIHGVTNASPRSHHDSLDASLLWMSPLYASLTFILQREILAIARQAGNTASWSRDGPQGESSDPDAPGIAQNFAHQVVEGENNARPKSVSGRREEEKSRRVGVGSARSGADVRVGSRASGISCD